MEYLKVKWYHQHQDEPIEIYSELNPERWEIRKVEIFRDGDTSYASPIQRTGTTWLAEAPLPALTEINAQKDFEGTVIDRQTFERMWLMSSEMITLHDPKLVQSLQKLVGKQPLNINELVEQAVQQYLETELPSSA